MKHLATAALLTVLTVAATACQATKSSNPLSPTVAGPIPGVNITAPKTLEPTNAKIAVGQPVRPTLVVTDAFRSGPVGAMSYQFELSDTDSFANKIVTGIVPEQPNQTSLALDHDLTSNTVFYWHARAFDPKTTGPWS